MSKKCIYCKTPIEEDSVVDVCRKCGIGVWGEKMFNAIIQSMENARDAGDLFQGSVTDPNVQMTGRNRTIGGSRFNDEPKKI